MNLNKKSIVTILLNLIRSIVIIGAICFFIVLVVCFFESITNERSVTENELSEIEVFIDSFYDYMDTSSQSEPLQYWYLNNEIQFYIASNFFTASTKKADYVLDNSEEDFFSKITNFSNKYGGRKKSELHKLSFLKTSYDIPINNFFFVQYDVEYEGIETYETFYIKKEGEIYKIYRYYITLLNYDHE